MMKTFLENEILKELVENDIQVTITKEGFEVSGFYKSGTVRLVPNEDNKTFTAISRYGERDRIEDFDDLVHLNKSWWEYSKERTESTIPPDSLWKEVMIKKGIIKVREEVVRHYE